MTNGENGRINLKRGFFAIKKAQVSGLIRHFRQLCLAVLMGNTDECKIPGFFNRPNDFILYTHGCAAYTLQNNSHGYALPFDVYKTFRYFREAVPLAEISLLHGVFGIRYIVCQGDFCVLRPSEAHI